MSKQFQFYTDLAIFNNIPLFNKVKTVSNIGTPNLDTFLKYLKRSYKAKCLINNGPATKEFEDRIAKDHNTKHCITFPNCLSSLICALSIFNPKPGSEVVTPSFAYRRFGDLIAWLGLIPHYCEVDAISLTPTIEMVKQCITNKTCAILLVQPMILITDFTQHYKLAQTHNLPLVIDSVEAPYSTCNGKRIGCFGDMECFSMHASKLINACDGGYITTNNDSLAEKLRGLRSSITGIGMEFDELHAVMALSSLEVLPEQKQRNYNKYLLYKKILNDINGITLIEYDRAEERVYKNIMVRIEDNWPFTREEMMQLTQSENMLTRAFWAPPLHTSNRDYPIVTNNLPITNKVGSNHLLLPCGELVTIEDIEKIGIFLNLLQQDSKNIKQKLLELKGNIPLPEIRTLSCEFKDLELIEKTEYNSTKTPKWKLVKKTFSNIFQRKWYTSNGPLLNELENKLEKFLQVKHSLCILNLSHAFMISLRAAYPDSVKLITELSPLFHHCLDIMGLKADTAFVKDSYDILLGAYTTDEWLKNKKIIEKEQYVSIIHPLGMTSLSCICTNSDYLAEKIRNVRTVPGIRKKIKVFGTGNGRVSEIQAAMGLLSICKVDR